MRRYTRRQTGLFDNHVEWPLRIRRRINGVADDTLKEPLASNAIKDFVNEDTDDTDELPGARRASRPVWDLPTKTKVDHSPI